MDVSQPQRPHVTTLGRTASVELSTRSAFDRRRNRLLARADRVAPGGNVGNALAAAARTFSALGQLDISVVWAGICDYDPLSLDALRELSENGITLRPTFAHGATTFA